MTTVGILRKGLFECFPAGLEDAGEPVNAEISAAAFNGDKMVVASDKDIPGDHRSPVLAIGCPDGVPDNASVEYYTADLIRTAAKYEDFSRTAAGNHMIATTGFDRVDDETAELHHYNRLIVWPVRAPDSPRLVADRVDEGVRSSVGLRADLANALGAPYYKVEGLAAVPGRAPGDERLLFGIRERGRDHEHFEYVACVVAAPYRMDGDDLVFTGAFEVIYDLDTSRWSELRFAVGLSSLEYDPQRKRVYLLTSFEVTDAQGDERVGAYLWQTSLADFDARRDPELVRARNGTPFEFANKAEGLAALGDDRLFVVYDPDRALDLEHEHPRKARAPHEAPYTVLALE